MYIVDFDGTLAVAFQFKVYNDVDKLQGQPWVLCTNQSGPWWRKATGQSKYPTAQHIGEGIGRVMHLMGYLQALPKAVYIAAGPKREHKSRFRVDEGRLIQELEDGFRRTCDYPIDLFISAKSSWRKPAAGMIQEIRARFKLENDECIFIGDSPDDQGAATKAGIDFIHANDFFQRI